MRKLVTLASIGALAVLGATMGSAQSGNPEAVSRSYTFDRFDKVSVVGPHRIVVSVGPAISVRAEGSQATLEDTTVEVENGRLKIHPTDDGRWERRCRDRANARDGQRWRCWEDYQAATFYVTLPQISAASVVGGATMTIDRVEGEDFAGSLAGSGTLDIAALRVNDARLSIAGSGDLRARGTARQSRVSIAGSGNLHARDVTSTDASISIAGSGNAVLTVQDAARVSIVGSGDVDIAGPARCSVSRLGSGNVRCGNLEERRRS